MSKEKQRKVRYTRELCRKMYLYYLGYDDRGAPSVQKFARSIGVTVAEIEAMRKFRRFDRAYRECLEIRRDYIIDRALDRRFDPSFSKFLLADEAEGMVDEGFTLKVEVAE